MQVNKLSRDLNLVKPVLGTYWHVELVMYCRLWIDKCIKYKKHYLCFQFSNFSSIRWLSKNDFSSLNFATLILRMTQSRESVGKVLLRHYYIRDSPYMIKLFILFSVVYTFNSHFKSVQMNLKSITFVQNH